MKPLWKAGSACYDWVDEDVLLGNVPEIAADNDDRLVTTFFDDDLEESRSGPDRGGKDPFIAQVPIQYCEPSGLDGCQLHEVGSRGKEGRSGPCGGSEDPANALVPIQHPQRSGSRTSSCKKPHLAGSEKRVQPPCGSWT